MSGDMSSFLQPKNILSSGVNYIKKSVTDPKTALMTFMSPAAAPLMSQLSESPQVDPPPVTPPTVMPTPDDKAIQDAKRRSIAAQMARRGRASTILTGNQSGGETLGG